MWRLTASLPRDPVRDRMPTVSGLNRCWSTCSEMRWMRPRVSSLTRRVKILLTVGDDTALITVRDNGSGDRRSRQPLFEPFYTTKAPGDGVGLGLAISSGIVKDLGGRLTARNGQRRRSGI